MTKLRATEPIRATPAALALALFAALGSSASAAEGTIAGKVYDKSTRELAPDVTVDAFSITSDQGFSVVTGPSGSYVVPGAPAGVYAFTLRRDGVDYPVRQRLDVRVPGRFILESCFTIDGATRTAEVRDSCTSGLVEEARVASVGPLRYFLPPQAETAGDLLDRPTGIEHDEIQCLTREHYPLVDAGIHPGELVQTTRVYFRSDKYPDFYYVEMTKDHPTVDDFEAVLPKPSDETERIIYYIESLDNEINVLQTPEYDPEVLETDECERRGAPAWYTGDPSIVVGATVPGAAAVPPGFQAIGITGFVNSLGVVTGMAGGAAGGGALGTTGILVVSGAAAGTAGAVVTATGDNKEASPP